MIRKSAEYLSLIDAFVGGEIDADEFSGRYLEKFKNEDVALPEESFMVLDGLFGDADSYTDDEKLLASLPAFYLNAEQLKEQAMSAAVELRLVEAREVARSRPPSKTGRAR